MIDAETATPPEDDMFGAEAPEQPVEAAPEAPPEKSDEDKAAEAAKIAELEKLIKIPVFAQDDYDGFESDRTYVNHDCMVAEGPESCTTNFILRNQFVLQSQIYARDPTISVQPKPWVGPYPPGLFDFAKTVELAARRFTQEAGLKQTLTGMLQDTQTCGLSWVKVSLQQDYRLDAIGANRHDDDLDNIAELRALIDGFQNSEFDESSAQYKTMLDLSDTVKTYMAGQIREDMTKNPAPPVIQSIDPASMMPVMGPDLNDPRISQLQQLETQGTLPPDVMLPDVPHFIGFNLDQVQPEDMRYDWSITRPEDFYQAAWVAHRVFMSKSQISTKWNLSEEAQMFDFDVKQSKQVMAKNHDDDPAKRDNAENPVVNDRHAVWELHDKRTGRIYTWVEGMDYFLSNVVPNPTWHKFFPFFPLIFNRTTGKFIPISDVRLQVPLQNEINTKRTHEREAQRASYPRMIVGAGLLDPGEKESLEAALPYSVTEVKRADEVAKGIHELKVQPFDPLLYDTSKAVREIEIMAGIPQQAAGGVGGAEFATEAAIANQQMGVQSDRRRDILLDLIRDINECIIEMMLQAVPEDNIKQLVGPGAVWPILSRENLWRQLQLDIKPGSSGKPDKQKELELWTQFATLAQSLGVVINGPQVFEKVLEVMELPVDLQRYTINPMVAQLLGGAPGGAAQPPPNEGGSPAGGQPGAGAPPMSEAGPPSPQNVPNAPSGNPM